MIFSSFPTHFQFRYLLHNNIFSHDFLKPSTMYANHLSPTIVIFVIDYSSVHVFQGLAPSFGSKLLSFCKLMNFGHCIVSHFLWLHPMPCTIFKACRKNMIFDRPTWWSSIPFDYNTKLACAVPTPPSHGYLPDPMNRSSKTFVFIIHIFTGTTEHVHLTYR